MKVTLINSFNLQEIKTNEFYDCIFKYLTVSYINNIMNLSHIFKCIYLSYRFRKYIWLKFKPYKNYEKNLHVSSFMLRDNDFWSNIPNKF